MGTLADKDEIRELMRRYNQAIDFPDLEAWMACWTDDGVMRFGERLPVVGKVALREYGSGRKGGTLHLATSEIVTIDGDEATVVSYITVGDGATRGSCRNDQPGPSTPGNLRSCRWSTFTKGRTPHRRSSS